MKHVLLKPLNDGPRIIREVTFVEPTAKELLRWSKAKPTDEFSAVLEGIALLTGVEPRVLENLAARDFVVLAKAAAELFQEA